MKSILLVTLTALSLAGFVQAEGDASAGKDKTMMCGACHGADGNSAVPSFPKLAGQGEKYLIKQMNDIHEGRRVVLTMAGVLDNMSQQDIADIAAYYSAQTGTVGQAKADLVELGERIYRAGNSEIGIAACTACHSPTGGGNAPAGFPKLGGQHAEYIEAQLKAFRTGAEEPEKGRANDGETRIMRDIVSRMSDLEIRAVSSYIQGLH